MENSTALCPFTVRILGNANVNSDDYYGLSTFIALHPSLEAVVTFHFSRGKVYSLNKGCYICMIMLQSLHCSIYLTRLDMFICMPKLRSLILKLGFFATLLLSKFK